MKLYPIVFTLLLASYFGGWFTRDYECNQPLVNYSIQRPYWVYYVPDDVKLEALEPYNFFEWYDRQKICNGELTCLRVYPMSEGLWADIVNTATSQGKIVNRERYK